MQLRKILLTIASPFRTVLPTVILVKTFRSNGTYYYPIIIEGKESKLMQDIDNTWISNTLSSDLCEALGAIIKTRELN